MTEKHRAIKIYLHLNKLIGFIFSFECCSGNNWANCQRFYSLFPPTLLSLQQILIIFGWGGGDPHMTTFDNFSYTFNGLGKYVFSRDIDKSFEIQGMTSILANINGSSSLEGTVFTSFAMKTNRSRIFQITLIDGDRARPYLVLNIDKQNEPVSDFQFNFVYQKDFECVDNKDEICTTIIQRESGTQFLFNNGLSLTFSVTRVEVNQVQTRSWISCSVNFIQTGKFNYQNKLQGLMGNWNGNDKDDIIGRNDEIPSILNERQIFDVANSWLVNDQEDLFTTNTVSRTIGRIRGLRRSTFRPIFLDELNINQNVNDSCNNNIQCIFDATVSGLTSVGKQTLNSIQEVNTAIEQTQLSPPSIVFTTAIIELNWDSDQILTIVATVIDSNSFDLDFITDNITDIDINQSSGLNRTVSISFKPIKDKLPQIGIKATDDTNLTNTIFFSQFYICKCQSLSLDNKCKFDLIEEPVEEVGFFVGCICEDYYEGTYCDQERNECLTGNVCDKEGNFNQKCSPLSVEEQKQTKRGYKCEGDCPGGYEKDEFGACKDILECSEIPARCKDGSTCLEKPGSFECVCAEGFRYLNDKCDIIDLCQIKKNDCEQICTTKLNGVECSCHPGFVFNQSTKKCDSNFFF